MRPTFMCLLSVKSGVEIKKSLRCSSQNQDSISNIATGITVVGGIYLAWLNNAHYLIDCCPKLRLCLAQ